MIKKMTKKEKKIIVDIAKKFIYDIGVRGDLEYRMNDDEDFIETGVGSLQAALYAAYLAGKNEKTKAKA